MNAPIPENIPRAQQVISVLWPSFLVAIVASGVFFSAFNPVDLIPFNLDIDISPLAAYSIGFFLFWILAMHIQHWNPLLHHLELPFSRQAEALNPFWRWTGTKWQPSKQKRNHQGFYAKHKKIYPREVSGRFSRLRVISLLGLLGIYYVTPLLQWDGRQAVLFDLPARKFYIFGLTLWPQDFIYLAAILILAGTGPCSSLPRCSVASGAAMPVRKPSGPRPTCGWSARSRATAPGG